MTFLEALRTTTASIKVWADGKFTKAPKVVNISMLAANWVGETSPYTQVVTVSNATVNSKIDLQPTAEQIVSLQGIGTSLMTENNDGVVTVYAIGVKPTTDYEMQTLITEVAAS